MDLQNAFVLHSRPFKESSLLIDIFTVNDGRISLVARAGRGRKNSQSAILQPFTLLNIAFVGRSGLKSMRQVEAVSNTLPLTGRRLFASFYLNELLYRLLANELPYPALFSRYQDALLALAKQAPMEPLLREFELDLMQCLGNIGSLSYCADTMLPVHPERMYKYVTNVGVVSSIYKVAVDNSFWGKDLLAFEQRQFDDENLLAAKRFCRQILLPYLGNKPLKSRELFINKGINRE
ncbi:MAG: DNA repair protein RecO (recombination protein O) [Moritella sp.]|jgi:DNA repair protein RecO (recombination protein O)